jgi:hypothetical protein
VGDIELVAHEGRLNDSFQIYADERKLDLSDGSLGTVGQDKTGGLTRIRCEAGTRMRGLKSETGSEHP